MNAMDRWRLAQIDCGGYRYRSVIMLGDSVIDWRGTGPDDELSDDAHRVAALADQELAAWDELLGRARHGRQTRRSPGPEGPGLPHTPLA